MLLDSVFAFLVKMLLEQCCQDMHAWFCADPPGGNDAAAVKHDHAAPRGNDARRGGNLTNVQRDHRRKDTNKAAVGNHHRKDRALRKMGGSAQQ